MPALDVHCLRLIHIAKKIGNRDEFVMFLNQKDENSIYTNAQTIYQFCWRKTRQIDKKGSMLLYEPFQKELDKLIGLHFDAGKKEMFLNVLERQRQIMQSDIMEQTSRLWHFTRLCPERIDGNYLIPNGSASPFKEKKVAAVFAGATQRSPHIIKWRACGKDYWGGFSENPKDEFVLLTNKEGFFKDPVKGYGYEVDCSTFKPYVTLGGWFNGEYVSEKPALILNKEKPIIASLQTVTAQGLQVFFASDILYDELTKKVFSNALYRYNTGKQFKYLKELSGKGIIEHYNATLKSDLIKRSWLCVRGTKYPIG